MAGKIRMVCGTCGSGNVMRDAWAVWDVATQEWVLGNVFDQGNCDDCGDETKIEEEPADSLPVVDGDEGAVHVYGHAINEADAREIAEAEFTDPIERIERYGPIRLPNGGELPEAWVAITKKD